MLLIIPLLSEIISVDEFIVYSFNLIIWGGWLKSITEPSIYVCVCVCVLKYNKKDKSVKNISIFK